MPTGQQIVSNALTILGILEQGGTPSVSDSVDCLGALNVMWDAWGIDEGLIYAILVQRFPAAAGAGTYTIGIGAQFNVQRPSRLYRAQFLSATGGAIATSSLGDGGVGYAAGDTGILLGGSGTRAIYTVATVDLSGAVLTYTLSGAGTGYSVANGYQTQVAGAQPGIGSGLTLNVLTLTTVGGQNRTELDLVAAEQYYAHNDLSATALTPDELYAEFGVDVDGFARLYLFPVPSAAAVLELQVGAPFTTWTLVDSYQIPQGFQDSIEQALAFRLLARFGAAVAPEVAAVVQSVGVKAEARIREMNARNRQMPAPSPPPGAKQEAK